MRLRYYDATGAVRQTRYGGQVCAFDDQHHSWSVDLDPYAEDSISRVERRRDKVRPRRGEYVATVGDLRRRHDWADTVQITESGVDFGGPGWANGVPDSRPGPVLGDRRDGQRPAAPQSARIHLNNSSGDCTRMNLALPDRGGRVPRLAGRRDGCAADNGHHSWSRRPRPVRVRA